MSIFDLPFNDYMDARLNLPGRKEAVAFLCTDFAGWYFVQALWTKQYYEHKIAKLV